MIGLYWHIDRWRQSAAYVEMTVEEQGAYRNLLDEATLRDGGIPNDERLLARVSCGGDTRVWKRVKAACLRRFELRDGVLVNGTLEKVLRASQTRIDRQQRYRDRLAAERAKAEPPRHEQRNAPRNGKRHAPHHGGRNRGRYQYQDQDQDVQKIPPTPRSHGGRSLAGKPFTRKELQEARADLRVYRDLQPSYVAPTQREPGRTYPEPRTCPHEPQCDDLNVCLVLFAHDRRQRIAAALTVTPTP